MLFTQFDGIVRFRTICGLRQLCKKLSCVGDMCTWIAHVDFLFLIKLLLCDFYHVGTYTDVEVGGFVKLLDSNADK